MSKLLVYKKANDARVIQNTNITTKCTHIGFATEDKAQYDALVGNPLYNHIIFTDRKNIPDANPVKDTLQVSQVHGSDYIVENGSLPLTTALLLYSCKLCRDNSLSVQDCEYRMERNVVECITKEKSDNNTEGNQFVLKKRTCAMLSDEL